PRMAGALPLASTFDRILGQSLHASQGDLGLLAAHAVGLPHPDQGPRAAGCRLILRAITFSLLIAGLALAAPAGGNDKLALRLDWITHPIHMPFFLAIERGWFAKAGLDVTVEDGNGSTTTVQIVGGGGNFELGHADLSPMAIGKSRGFPVISIAGFI